MFYLFNSLFLLKMERKSASKIERRNKELEEARELQNSLLPKSILTEKIMTSVFI